MPDLQLEGHGDRGEARPVDALGGQHGLQPGRVRQRYLEYDARYARAVASVTFGGTGMTVHHARVIALAAVLVGLSALVPSARVQAQQPISELPLDELRALPAE